MDDYKLGCRSYNTGNVILARKMRKRPTLAEQSMREFVLKYKPNGYKFTRQKPLGPFIADFHILLQKYTSYF